jgi:acyl-CoA synthetase (AMP-forming)/AMP-acid ligase II
VSDTLVAMLERAARFGGHGLRLLDRREEETWLPWPQLVERAAMVAGGLRANGVRAGERVALVYPTGAEFLAAFFGTLAAGAAPTPLYPPMRLGRLDEYRRRTARMVAAAGARLALVEAPLRSTIAEALAESPPPLGVATLDDLPRAVAQLAAPDPEALGLVQFSSGTTAEPKPVALSHRALCAQARALNAFWPESEGIEHSGVSWLPLYHDMGLVGCVLTALERPGTLTLFSPELFAARPALWLRAISRYRATLSPAPNFGYALAAERIRDEDLEGVDLSSWRVALNGAEPIAPQTLERFATRFAPWGFRREALTPVYGLSEAALAVTFSDPARAPRTRRFDRQALDREGRARESAAGRELVSVGRALPGFEVSIRDRAGAALAEDRVGRVLARGPSMMTEYLGNPAASAAALADGWLDTGDLGFLDDGELYLVGRAKDLLILRGKNHDPQDVEHAALGVEGARAGCAVAVSHLAEGASGERLLVFVEYARSVPESGRVELGEAARRAVLERTGLDPDEVVVLAPGSLPRTSSGKLRRQEALRRHLEGELDARAVETVR